MGEAAAFSAISHCAITKWAKTGKTRKEIICRWGGTLKKIVSIFLYLYLFLNNKVNCVELALTWEDANLQTWILFVGN